MRDANGDLKADTKVARHAISTDELQANVEHNANGLLWALDNWIYTSEVDVYLRLKHGQVRGAQDARPRAVGPVAGRRRPR